MVRDEQDVIEAFVRHHAAQVDGLLIADNLSTDHTRGILDDLADELPLVVTVDPDPAYRQSEKMTALADRARVEFGAEWIIPADADEFWQPLRMPTLAELCAAQPDEVGILPAAIYDHVVTGTEGFAYMTHRLRLRTPLHKVAVRARADLIIEMGNHSATYGDPWPAPAFDLLQVRHFPIRTAAQYVRKARQGSAALRLTDLPDDVGKHWRDWDRLTDAQLAEVFAEHWTYDPADPAVVFDPL
jgi:hypothetical protein